MASYLGLPVRPLTHKAALPIQTVPGNARGHEPPGCRGDRLIGGLAGCALARRPPQPHGRQTAPELTGCHRAANCLAHGAPRDHALSRFPSVWPGRPTVCDEAKAADAKPQSLASQPDMRVDPTTDTARGPARPRRPVQSAGRNAATPKTCSPHAGPGGHDANVSWRRQHSAHPPPSRRTSACGDKPETGSISSQGQLPACGTRRTVPAAAARWPSPGCTPGPAQPANHAVAAQEMWCHVSKLAWASALAGAAKRPPPWRHLCQSCLGASASQKIRSLLGICRRCGADRTLAAPNSKLCAAIRHAGGTQG